MVEKNLFLYDLSVVAIMKCEGPYLKEWLDYHLLAGVDHFYLYDNDSPDNQVEVAAPYVDAGLVDYFPTPGKCMQIPVYNDAIKRFKFQTRYMAFIDGDEFIFPKSSGGGCIIDAVDEILSRDTNAAGLGINWHAFGSNSEVNADFSRGVLERFTRRAHNDWCFMLYDNKPIGGNPHVKSIHNPRKVYRVDCHCANYFSGCYSINEHGKRISWYSTPPSDDKIIVNHYYTKSLEEYTTIKRNRKYADRIVGNVYTDNSFKLWDRNEEFDDGILRYRDKRAKIYQPPKARSAEELIKALERNLSTDSYAGKLETFLTCRAVAAYLQTKLADNSQAKFYEELSITAALKSLVTLASSADRDLFLRELPALLCLPYPVVKEIYDVSIPQIMDFMRMKKLWRDYAELDYVRDLLKCRE